MMAVSHLYAGWIVVDMRLLAFCIACSCLFSVGVVAGFLRTRKWHEVVTAFLAVFAVVLGLFIVTLNFVASYPVFMVKAMFPFP